MKKSLIYLLALASLPAFVWGGLALYKQRPLGENRTLNLGPSDGGRTSRGIDLAARASALRKTDPKGAIALYRQALASDPRDPMTRLDLARTLATNGQADEARAVYQDLARQEARGEIGIASNDPSLTAGPIHQIDARFRLPELDHVPAHAKANALFAAGVGKLQDPRQCGSRPAV